MDEKFKIGFLFNCKYWTRWCRNTCYTKLCDKNFITYQKIYFCVRCKKDYSYISSYNFFLTIIITPYDNKIKICNLYSQFVKHVILRCMYNFENFFMKFLFKLIFFCDAMRKFIDFKFKFHGIKRSFSYSDWTVYSLRISQSHYEKI